MPTRKSLDAYPQPSVAVDVALLTALPPRGPGGLGTLAVLIQPGRDESTARSLPGRFLREKQTVADSVADVLQLKVGLDGVSATPRVLKVFDDPGRDPRGWTLSLAHALTLPIAHLRGATGELVGITMGGTLESGESLLYDHDAIVREAAATIRERYERLPDPDGLLEHPFTMAELRTVHEAVIGERLLKDTFRRRMEPLLQPLVDEDGRRILRSDGGRPAQVYERAEDAHSFASPQRRMLLPRAVR